MEEYLNEEKYQKAEKKIVFIALIVLIVGLSLGGFLIYRGVKPNTAKLDDLKKELESKQKDLELKGVVASSNYKDGESYDLYIIDKALDPSFSWCHFEESKNNSLTKEYCKAKISMEEFSTSAFIMFGAFICIATLMFSGSIYATAKRRKILAFSAQQVMPVAQEGIEKMAPSIGKAAKDIAKGIKEGLSDEEDE